MHRLILLFLAVSVRKDGQICGGSTLCHNVVRARRAQRRCKHVMALNPPFGLDFDSGKSMDVAHGAAI